MANGYRFMGSVTATQRALEEFPDNRYINNRLAEYQDAMEKAEVECMQFRNELNRLMTEVNDYVINMTGRPQTVLTLLR